MATDLSDFMCLVPGISPVFTICLSGNMAFITDDTGAVAAKFSYTPFGEVIDRVIAQRPACNIPIGFAGAFGVLTEPNGLYYMNARYYDPAIGRFLSEDPLGPGGGDLTLYSYAGSNPVVFVNPSGLCRVSGEAYIAKRPLEDKPWLGFASDNPIDNFFNTEVSHEQLFFPDGTNIGFFNDNNVRADKPSLLNTYRTREGGYDPKIMQEAVQMTTPQNYRLLLTPKYNCQDYMDAVRENYYRIIGRNIPTITEN